MAPTKTRERRILLWGSAGFAVGLVLAPVMWIAADDAWVAQFGNRWPLVIPIALCVGLGALIMLPRRTSARSFWVGFAASVLTWAALVFVLNELLTMYAGDEALGAIAF